MSSSTLLHLPAEILTQILTHLPPTSLLSFASASKHTYTFVSPNPSSSNPLLWRAVFLQIFDDPRDSWNILLDFASGSSFDDAGAGPTRPRQKSNQDSWDWFAMLRRRVIALRYMDPDISLGSDLLAPAAFEKIREQVATSLLDILDTAKSCLTPREIREGKKQEIDDRSLSSNLRCLPYNCNITAGFDGLVRGLPVSVTRRNAGFEFDGGRFAGVGNMPGAWVGAGIEESGARVGSASIGPVTRSQAAKERGQIVRTEAGARLHVLCGLTRFEEDDALALGQARRVVYDWSLTTAENDYGPFKSDGSGEVDWLRLEAVFSVVARQFTRATRGRLAVPQDFCFSIPYRTLPVHHVCAADWAGVQDGWTGTYCFLQWEELVMFNGVNGAGEIEDADGLEAGPEYNGGVMKLDLKLDLDGRRGLKDDPRLKSDLPLCKDLPPLYFSGMSNSQDFQMTTKIRGCCWLVPGGREVRWRYIVHYSGSDQWQLEGVQPGGIRSGCVYGYWTSCAHEDGAPVGGFMYAPEELCKSTSIVLVR